MATTVLGGAANDASGQNAAVSDDNIKVLIVEDDAAEADRLLGYLSRYANEHGEKFEVSRLESAVDFLDTKPEVDLIFMDIGLPGISGMEAAEILRDYDQKTQLIFVTSLAQYGARSYEVDALDFIVKPVGYSSFAMRMDRAVRVLRRTIGRSIMVRTKDGMRIMPLADIIAIEVRGHNLLYHLTDNSEYSVRGTLSGLSSNLEGTAFVRVSSGVLVNMDRVRSIHGPDVQMSDGSVYSISRPRRTEALEAIARYYGGE